MPVCPQCFSRDMIKFGKFGGQQKWHCQLCELTTIHPRMRQPKRIIKERIRLMQMFIQVRDDLRHRNEIQAASQQ